MINRNLAFSLKNLVFVNDEAYMGETAHKVQNHSQKVIVTLELLAVAVQVTNLLGLPSVEPKVFI